MSQALSPTQIPFSSLGFFSRLYRQYCDGFDALASYFQRDPRSADDRRLAADAAAARAIDREVLVAVLEEQNAQWGRDDAVAANVNLLRDPRSVAVVTGQQVGLLTGPLYTVYKSLTVLQAARRLATETGRPVVPVFWLEVEDHDFAEISTVMLLSNNDPAKLEYTGHSAPSDGNLGPVGRLTFTPQIERVVDELDALLPPTDFKPDLLAAVRDAYRAGTTLLDAFARLMRHIFRGTGLVFIASDDPRLKAQVRPLFEKEIRETYAVAERVNHVSAALREDFHAQVSVRPTNLFLIDDDGRHAVDATGEDFHVRGRNRTLTSAELLEIARVEPERLSANVVLRPLVQDSLLPTAIYVAGPSEVAYFAQLKPVYEWAGIPMPVIYPRASVTLVEGKVKKVLDAYGLSVGQIDEDLDSLFQRIVREQLDSAVDQQFEGASRHLHEAVNALRPLLQDVDRTLVSSAESTRTALVKELDRLRHRVLKAEKRKHEQVRDRLEKAQVNLFPTGKPQERTISILYFLNKYGPELISRLDSSLELDCKGHQVLHL